MKNNSSFRSYTSPDRAACLKLFDDNCPEYFAVNEREDYAQFLDSAPTDYEVCIIESQIVGAFGLLAIEQDQDWRDLNWILISPDLQRIGIGSTFFNRVVSVGGDANVVGIKIAASHLSAPFFAKHGAMTIQEIENGWGIGMHRVDMELKI